MMASRSSDGNLTQMLSQGEMLRILECPVCQEVPYPPIHQCLQGHSICKNCRPKVYECPLCRGGFSTTRNYTVEEIILSSLHACSYKNAGCSNVEKGSLMEKHMEECQFRPTKCPYYGLDGCFSALKSTEIKPHIIAMHKVRVDRVSGLELRYFIPNEYKTGFQIHSPNAIFEFECQTFLVGLVSNDTAFYWVVLMIGSDEEIASKYYVDITLQHDKHQSISWKIPIHATRNRTIQSFAFEETNILKPYCRWEDLKLMGIPEAHGKFSILVSYRIARKIQNPPVEVSPIANSTTNLASSSNTVKSSSTLQRRNVPAPIQIPNPIAEVGGARVYVYMKFKADNISLGQIMFELRADIVPRTVENFRALCTGEKGFGYKGSKIHQIVPQYNCIGGDLANGNKSIYGNTFPDENFTIRHTASGILSMANCGANTNGSQFIMAFAATQPLDGKNVAFGIVLDGMEVLRKIESYGNRGGRRSRNIVIEECGQL